MHFKYIDLALIFDPGRWTGHTVSITVAVAQFISLSAVAPLIRAASTATGTTMASSCRSSRRSTLNMSVVVMASVEVVVARYTPMTREWLTGVRSIPSGFGGSMRFLLVLLLKSSLVENALGNIVIPKGILFTVILPKRIRRRCFRCVPTTDLMAFRTLLIDILL